MTYTPDRTVRIAPAWMTPDLYVREINDALSPDPLLDAIAYWRAESYSAPLDALVDLSGHSLHARLGSAVGADTNDPLRLIYSGEQYVYNSGVIGNTITTPDLTTFPTSDIDLRIRLAADDYTNGTNQVVMAKYSTAGNRSMRLWISTTGALTLEILADGVTSSSTSSSVSIPFADGTAGWLRVTWRQSDGRTQFFTAADQMAMPTVWSQLGSDRSIIAAGIFDSTAVIEVGAGNTSNVFTGRIFYAEFRAGIDGTVIAAFDASRLVEPFRYYSPTPNLLPKDVSDLENSLGSWTTDGTPVVTRTTLVSQQGSAALDITYVDNTSAGAISNPLGGSSAIPVKANTSYAMSMQSRAATTPKTVLARVSWYDATGTLISTVTIASALNAVGSWTLIAGTVMSPSNAAYALPRIQTTSPASTTQYFDAIGFFETATVPSWSAGGVPWRIQRSSTGRKLTVVDRTFMLFGTDDYCEVPDSALLDLENADSFTVGIAFRSHDTSAAHAFIVKHDNIGDSAGDVGWKLRGVGTTDGVRFALWDGISSTAPTLTGARGDGFAKWIVGIRDRSDDTATVASRDSAGQRQNDITNASMANALTLRIGRLSGAGTSYADMVFIGAAIWRRALSDAEMDAVAASFGVH